jgi:hypothetical protein
MNWPLNISYMRSGIECLKSNRKNSHQQPLPGSLGKTGQAKAEAVFFVRVHPEPCLILSRAQIRALLCS